MSNSQYSSIDHDTVKDLINEVDGSPEKEYEAEIELINSIEALENAELSLKLKEDAQYLLAEGKTVKDKDAMVTAITEEELRNVIDKKIDNLKKKAAYNKLVNKFTAVRKKIGAIEAMLNARL